MPQSTPTTVPAAERVQQLETAIHSILDQQMDNICWMDPYVILGALVGRPFDPLKLPRELFKKNCDRYADHVYSALPYDKDALTTLVAQFLVAKNALIDAGFDSKVGLVGMVNAVLHALKENGLLV